VIIVLILAVVLCALYAVWTFHYRKHWKENFQVELCFSEEQAGVGDTLFLYETAINKKKMKIPTICVKFGASKELAFEDMEHGTVSDQYYRNDVMSVDSFQKVRRKLKLTCKKRGLYHIRQAELVSYDLFCTQTFVHKLDVDATLCVYPSRMDVTKLLPVLSRQSGGGTNRHLAGKNDRIYGFYSCRNTVESGIAGRFHRSGAHGGQHNARIFTCILHV
jgi:hypothetical protein